MLYNSYIGRAQSLSEIIRKENGKMVYNENCSCGNPVVITTSESGYKADGNSKSYVIKCSKCDSVIREISSGTMPAVTGGYVD